MKRLLGCFLCLFIFVLANAQDEIVINLDSIKNIKSTRYSSINEVGVGINVGGKLIQKFPNNTQKRTLGIDKPDFIFRTVHGALINPKLFIGAGFGIDFRPNGNYGSKYFYFTFPIFAEFREYFLNGNFNLFVSQRIGGAFHIDSYFNNSINKGRYSGAFGEFMLGGRYVTNGKKLAVHFGVGYRLQHLQRKVDIQDLNGNAGQTYNNVPEITIKHYVPITIGITY